MEDKKIPSPTDEKEVLIEIDLGNESETEPTPSEQPTPEPVVDESKFANIYEKYNGRIRETFGKQASFLDVERLAREEKEHEDEEHIIGG